MITCQLMGGLGNQLFQIFATISYAIKSRNQFKFLNVPTLGGNGCTLRYTYWDHFLSKLKPFLIPSIPYVHVMKEHDFMFHELSVIEMINRDVMIQGYFQSYKYFKEYYDIICKIIGLETSKRDLLKKLNYEPEQFKNIISMHFRIGDYKNIQHIHPVMPKEYYLNALNHIKRVTEDIKYKILYFCEDVDIADVQDKILYLQNQFPEYEFIRGDNNLRDWEQMLLMSCCHHNIIPNSSFSWWAAYFNSWSDKSVCYPSVWFGPGCGHNVKDLCPSEWTKIFV